MKDYWCGMPILPSPCSMCKSGKAGHVLNSYECLSNQLDYANNLLRVRYDQYFLLKQKYNDLKSTLGLGHS
jgi:hypothetical protein